MLPQLTRTGRCILMELCGPQKLASTIRNGSSQKGKNKAAVLCAVKDLRVEEVPMPTPQQNQVLLRMCSVGICGSDVKYYKHGKINEYVLKDPMVIGHEGSGIVEKLGPCVENLKVGDRVAVEPAVPCRMCSYCKEGRYNLCPHIMCCATPPVDGNMARYYVHTADFCHKIPDCITMEEGALLEPLAVAVHACRRAKLSCGARVLIVGSGPMGLATVRAARAFGARKIVITDLNAHRLEIAKKMGADATVKIAEGMDDAKVAEEIQCQLGGPAHVCIECCGKEAAISQGLRATRYGGVFVLLGMGKENARLPLIPIFHEVKFLGSFRYANDYPTAVKLMAAGKADLTQMITHCFKLKEANKAMETAAARKDNAIKIIVHCEKKKEAH